MSFEYNFPQATKCENAKTISKSRLISKASLGTKLTAVLKRDVNKIIWAYKLSPETTNISACKQVQEIQVFSFNVAVHNLNLELLKSIDKVIPSPILFQLEMGIEFRYVMAYKRVSKKNSYRVENYFSTPWMIRGHVKLCALPAALDLCLLYRAFLNDLSQIPCREDEAVGDFAVRAQMLQSKQKQVERLEQQYRNQNHNRLKQEAIRCQQNQLQAEINQLKK